MNAVDKEGQTALDYAQIHRHNSTIEMLEKAPTKLNRGFQRAFSNNQPEMVAELIEAGADISIAGDKGFEALSWAARRGHTVIVPKLLEKGADVDSVDDDGWTALVWAAKRGHS